MKKILPGLLLSILLLTIAEYSYAQKADTLSVTVRLSLEADDVEDNSDFKNSVSEVLARIQNENMALVGIMVYGSTSPDGPLSYNRELSRSRADNAAFYLIREAGLSGRLIKRRYLDEDWKLLEYLVGKSDLSEKDAVLAVIRSENPDERKQMLMKLSAGRVWKQMKEEFFPELRYVRMDFICNIPEVMQPEIKSEYRSKETLVDNEVEKQEEVAQTMPLSEESAVRADECERWRFGVKTNLLSDVVAVPSLGLEFQIGRYFSFDIQGCVMAYNIFSTTYRKSHFYAISPEIRFWMGGESMRKGHFLGVHGNYALYSMQMPDGLIYQNGFSSIWDGILDGQLPVTPAWSAGLTYGYSFSFGNEGRWGLELLAGAGYLSTVQDVSSHSNTGNLAFGERQRKYGWELTKVGVNFTYRFPIL